MFDKISSFIDSLFNKKISNKSSISNEVKIAIAELLYYVALSDNKLTAEERTMIYSTTQDCLGIPITFLEKHLSEMNKGINTKINLDYISSILKEKLSQDERDNLVQFLKMLSYSNNQLEAEEDYRIWEIAQMLHVETTRPLSQSSR